VHEEELVVVVVVVVVLGGIKVSDPVPLPLDPLFPSVEDADPDELALLEDPEPVVPLVELPQVAVAWVRFARACALSVSVFCWSVVRAA
jgi:hypothetical protein